MKKATTALAVLLTLAATVAPAFARAHRGGPAPYGHVNSGYSAPSTWDEIEVSHPDGGM